MTVDSFKFLPRIIATYYRMAEVERRLPIPWTPLRRPLSECTVGLVTSGGLYLRDSQPPFDLEREKQQPTWGDPTYRPIPTNVHPADLGVGHLHYNARDAEADFNILLPIEPLKRLAEDGVIGAVAPEHFSFMGFQGFPPDTTAWEKTYGPEVADRFVHAGADCVILTPA